MDVGEPTIGYLAPCNCAMFSGPYDESSGRGQCRIQQDTDWGLHYGHDKWVMNSVNLIHAVRIGPSDMLVVTGE